MGIVGLLRLHKRLGFQIRRMRILRRFRLHKLRYGVTPAIHVDHHVVVPQKTRRLGQSRRACQFIIALVFAYSNHPAPLASSFSVICYGINFTLGETNGNTMAENP